MKSNEWIKRQKSDYYVKKAKEQGYLSRSAFKLIEIEEKFNLIVKAFEIIEFGAAPGGWNQVILNTNPEAKITSIDLLELKLNHSNINFFKSDINKFDYSKFSKKFDLVLSDVAPNATGHRSTDHLRISGLVFDIIYLFDKILKKNGSFITKIWKGSEEKKILKILNNNFDKVSYFKPKSSRKNSSEIFLVATKFIKL